MDAAQVPLQPLTTGVRRTFWALVPLLLLAWALRLPPILTNRLHPDEALYGYWGLLIVHGQDVWLANVPVYKPPLMPYLIAGAQALFGNSEFVVRLPGLAAGLLTVPLTAALARSLYRDRQVTTATAIGVALSPFAIAFSATAFIDPLSVALGLAACAAAARNRPGWAGVWAGLSFAAKQTGLAWLPLAIMLYLAHAELRTGAAARQQVETWILATTRVLLPALAVTGAAFAWDAVRTSQGAESFWRVGVSGYGGLRLIWPHELWPRLRGWAAFARYLFVSPVGNALALASLPALAVRALACRPSRRHSLTDLLLATFVLTYSLLHWLCAFPLWSRYLLPLVPALAILMGRGLALLISAARRMPPVAHRLSHAACLLALAGALLLPAWNAAQSRYPIVDELGRYDGIDQIAAFLSGQPAGTVVYHHWLGWEYSYYLFDAPVCLAYWPTPAWLARDVEVFGRQGLRYIAFPSWESSDRIEQALVRVGYGLTPVLTTTRRDGAPSFTLYRIEPLVNR